MSVLSPPKQILKQIEGLLFKFLWNGNDKVKRHATYNDYSEGGLRMPNVEIVVKSLRLAWLQRLLNDQKAF